MSEWDDFQEENGEWADETFGTGYTCLPGTIAHLKKEVRELARKPLDGWEYADCMILLLDAARRTGIPASLLLGYCKAKLEINKKRKWGAPDKDGVVEHIKEEVGYCTCPTLDSGGDCGYCQAQEDGTGLR